MAHKETKEASGVHVQSLIALQFAQEIGEQLRTTACGTQEELEAAEKCRLGTLTFADVPPTWVNKREGSFKRFCDNKAADLLTSGTAMNGAQDAWPTAAKRYFAELRVGAGYKPELDGIELGRLIKEFYEGDTV